MRLTAIILLSACLTVSARGLAQLSFSGKDVPLKTVFSAIEKQSGYVFFYDADLLRESKPVTIDVKNVPIETFLQECLKDQPLEYEIKVKTIFITRKTISIADSYRGEAQAQGEITGRITNVQGEPLAGASITLKRTGKGTIADAKGTFKLKNIDPEDMLQVSYTGYKTQTVRVGEKRELSIILEAAVDELDKVVVQAYGTTNRRFATGNIGVVSAEEIEKQPVMNPLLALQGRVAGLDITQSSGYASAPIKAEIRGKSSIDPRQTNEPLYVIDGVPLTIVEIGNQSSYGNSTGFIQNGFSGPAGGQSPLFNISPSDIESISVLKDADATSIYGSRGANGVILITTKKGKPGKTQFNFHVEQGINKVSRRWKMLNTRQYLDMRREAFKNDGLIPDPGSAPDFFIWDTTRYTDWQKVLYGNTGKVTNLQASVSGGNENTSFRIGANYMNSQEITTANGSDQRASLSFNIRNSSINRRFTLSFTGAYSFTKSDMIDLAGNSLWAPNAPWIYDSLGRLDWKGWQAVGGNPFVSLLQPYTAKTNFLNGNLVLSYELTRGLSISTNLGYNYAVANQTMLYPISSQDPASQPTGSAQFGNNTNKNWIIEPEIKYEARLGRGYFSALVGASAQQNVTDGVNINGSGYTSDALLRTITAAPRQKSKENYGEYRYASVFARVGYNLKDRYVLNLNARRDGSSNYGPGNQYGNFASVGAAWLFSEEAWFKKHISFISFGKLRGSYGIAGSDGGLPYAYITRWAAYDQTYHGIVPLYAIQHANPDYKWQQNRKLEGAIDLGFFKDRITINIAYYRNRTGNQLLQYPTPQLSGFLQVVDNLDALVQNAGWEFTVSGKGIHVHSKFFNWDWAPNITFSINRNKFLSFSGLAAAPYRNGGLIGKPLNGKYIVHYLGVDPQTGTYTYEDKNHDGTIDPNYGPTGDVYYKKNSPTFSTGFGFNFDIKGFNLSLFFFLKKQEGVNAIAQGASPGFFNRNQPVEVLARWQKPGDVTNVAKFSTQGAQDPYGQLSNSDLGITDASYLRLQNLSLTYDLTDHVFKKSGFKCNIFLRATNLFTITKYRGIDPETQNFGGLPPMRTVTGGLSFDL